MAIEPKRIHVDTDTAVSDLLQEADKAPVVLEKDGLLYRLTQAQPDDVWAGYDPERTRQALARSAGALKGVDVDELLADIYAQREQDSHGRPA